VGAKDTGRPIEEEYKYPHNGEKKPLHIANHNRHAKEECKGHAE